MVVIRLATFNVENMFERPKVMNLPKWSQGAKALEDYTKLNLLINKPAYSAADKTTIVDLLKKNGIDRDDDGPNLVLRKIRGTFLKRPKLKAQPVTVVANGRGDWVGWVDLQREVIREIATENAARVFKEVGAHVMAVVEAENRIALQRFNDQLLPYVGGGKYDNVMVVDGNDDRGIDVGLMCRGPCGIASLQSHVDDRDKKGNRIFSRDCPEYEVDYGGNGRLWILVNHLKSKGYGPQPESDARRKVQAKRVREIYESHRKAEHKYVAIVGDFNDYPGHDPLSPLLSAGSDLKDVSQHPKFVGDGRPGTYGNGTESDKIDYILLSPGLFAKVQGGGVMRKGVWGGKKGDLWPHFPEMKKEIDAASDHAALWANLKV